MTLALLPPGLCPTCGCDLHDLSWDELPLLRHGGYGAARRTVRRSCPDCGWALNAERSEVRP